MGKVKKLDEDDFFIMNRTFSIWLQKKKSKNFDDLSSSKQRKYFKKFAKKWNKSDLSSIYYDEDKLFEKYGDLLTKKSVWKIQNNPEVKVNLQLKEYEEALSGVNQTFDFKNDETIHSKALKKSTRPVGEDREDKEDDNGVRKSRNEMQYDREKQREDKRYQDKYDRRQERKNQEDLLDELVPKKVGKEALLDKKKTINSKINGPRDNTGIDDYDDDFLIGGDSFENAKAREEEYQRRRNQKQQGYKYELSQKQLEYRNQESNVIQSAFDKQSYANRFK